MLGFAVYIGIDSKAFWAMTLREYAAIVATWAKFNGVSDKPKTKPVTEDDFKKLDEMLNR